MTTNITPEELAVFLAEADELLQQVEESLVQLEQATGDEEAELIQQIFRGAHTLKGSAATIGRTQMAELTHAMENVLDRLRHGTLSLSTAIIDVLLECLDALRLMKNDIADDVETTIDYQPLLSRLADVDAGEAGAASTPAAAGPSTPSGAVGTPAAAALSPAVSELLTRCRAARANGETIWLVSARLKSDCELPSVRAFQIVVALEQCGEVLASQPTMAEIERDSTGNAVTVVFMSHSEPDQLRSELALVGDVDTLELQVLATDADLTAALSELSGSISASAAANEVAAATAAQAAVATAKADPVEGTATGSPAAGGSAQKRNSVRSGQHTVRIDVQLLDDLMNLVGELVIDRTRLSRMVSQVEKGELNDDLTRDLAQTVVHIGRVGADLQEEIMKSRMLAVEGLFRKYPRLVRDLAQKSGKEIEFTMTGQETELDRVMLEEISDPLMHLLRNAVDHGIESPDERERLGKPRAGKVTLAAEHEESHIVIAISDDGKGIDPERIRASAIRKGVLTPDEAQHLTQQEAIDLIFAPGFSTAEQVSDLSGRGVGMDVVRTNIQRLSGTVEVDTAVGRGTTFRLKVPLTLAIIKALLVKAGAGTYCLPIGSVSEALHLDANAVQTISGREVIINRGQVTPLIHMRRLFGEPERAAGEALYVVIISFNGEDVALAVDALIGQQEVVIKSLSTLASDATDISGATILADGGVGLIIDVPGLIRKAMARAEGGHI